MTGASETPARWMPWFATVMVAIVTASIFTLVLAQQLRRESARLAALRATAEACPQRVVRSDDTRILMHADAPASQALGKHAYSEYGIDIVPLLRLYVERVRASGGVERVRLGAPEILSPKAIHVLGLWAPWCEACKELFPHLRDLFARRSDWGDAVRFVPVQVLDPSSPDLAVARWRASMPPSRVQLADRSLRDEFVDILRDEQRRLYNAKLPVVLIVDCNRRVRWAKLAGFAADDLADFERRVDQFIAELRDRAFPCAEVWCGNGRCEAGEAGQCADDCEAAPTSVVAQTPSPPMPTDMPRPTPTPMIPTCPEGCPECDDEGHCMLWGEPESRPRAATEDPTCGDGDCERDEKDCCKDCGCPSLLVCREDATGAHSCQPALWASPP